MKTHIKQFVLRGALFAWGGPIILAIVWAILGAVGAAEALTVREAVLGIVSTTLMAFIAAGISIVYQIETLPKATAALIQMAVLYLDYLGFYLLNGWLPTDKVWVFTLIFAAGFAAIWLTIYLTIRSRVRKMNALLHHQS